MGAGEELSKEYSSQSHRNDGAANVLQVAVFWCASQFWQRLRSLSHLKPRRCPLAVSLMVYGFVQVRFCHHFPCPHRAIARRPHSDRCGAATPNQSPPQVQEPPLLCSIDLKDFDVSDPWTDTETDDSALEVRSFDG